MARKNRLALVLAMAGALLALSAAVAVASFHPIDGSLNTDTAKNGDNPSVVDFGDVPYVAFGQENANTYNPPQGTVKRLDGATWTTVGGTINNDPTKLANPPSLANVGGDPYVAWNEGGATVLNVFVKRFDGTNWVSVGPSVNSDTTHVGAEPSIASFQDAPWVAYPEGNGSGNQAFVRVKRFDGATWVQMGGTLNSDPVKLPQGVRMTSVGGAPYVTWFEGPPAGHQDVRVSRFDGANWVAVGGALNLVPTDNAVRPTIADIGGVPYVAWREGAFPEQIRVARFDGTNWVPVGGSLNVDPSKPATSNPTIVNVAGAPWVTWSESTGAVANARVKRWDGSAWVSVGGALNVDPSAGSAQTSLGVVGGVPFATWMEFSGGAYQVRVARELAPTCNGGSVAVPHDTATTVPLQCTDADGDTLTISIVTGPAHGTLSAIDQGAGTVSYTPTSGYTGPDSISFKANDGAFDSNVATVSLTVAPAGQPPPLPVISRLAVSPKVFPAARKGASVARTTGTKVSYRNSQLTTSTFTVLKPAAGIIRGGKCVKRKAGQTGKRCTRLVKQGRSFTHKDRAGTNSFHFTGRVRGRTRYVKLKPGSYRLRAVPGFKGRTGKAKTVRFRIIR